MATHAMMSDRTARDAALRASIMGAFGSAGLLSTYKAALESEARRILAKTENRERVVSGRPTAERNLGHYDYPFGDAVAWQALYESLAAFCAAEDPIAFLIERKE